MEGGEWRRLAYITSTDLDKLVDARAPRRSGKCLKNDQLNPGFKSSATIAADTCSFGALSNFGKL